MAAEVRHNGSDKAGDHNGDLVGDQTWKKIQQNTFTRWVNQQLRAAGASISDLEVDLVDGIQLIHLAEVLSGKRMPRYNKKPTLRTQMLDNVSQALKFFQDDEGIKIVNIDSMHIVDRNLKLILGLIYTLIMHYSISKATLDGTASERDAKQSPKGRLLAWIKSRLPNDVPVTNFTSDWNDGVALGALVDACVPGSCADWRSWKPDDALENTRRAMQAAEHSLGIADLITPEELINPNVDEKSVMTYLSQFPQARVQAQGQLSGLDSSPMIGRDTQFAVDLARADMRPCVEITNLHGDALPVKIEPNAAFTTRFEVTYMPEQVGIHKITVSATNASHPSGDKGVDGVRIAEATVNAVPAPQLVGLRPRTELGDEERFRVTNVADGHQLNVVVVGADGREFEVLPSERVGNASVCRYRPDMVGLHSLNVFVDRRHIPGSPFPVRVVNKATDRVVVWGRGIHPEGCCAGDELPVHVDACDQPVTVSVTTKEGLLVPVISKFSHLNSTPSKEKDVRQKPGHSGKSDLRNHRQTFAYVPRSAGIYHIEVRTASGAQLGKSPYEVKVGPRSRSSVRAIGPGIEGGVKNKKSRFYIDTFGGANSLEFSIEGPNETQIACRDNGDSSAVVDYVPVTSGLYVVNVLNNGEHIKDSPFVLVVDSDDEDSAAAKSLSPASLSTSSQSISGSTASLVSLDRQQPHIPTVRLGREDTSQTKNFYVGEPVEFTIQDSNKPTYSLDVIVYGPDLTELPLVRTGKNAEHVRFAPEKPGKHVVSVCCDGIAVPDWPQMVNVKSPLDLSRLRVYGPGVGASNIFVEQRTNFTVDSQLVGSNAVSVTVHDPAGRLLENITFHQEANPNVHTVGYTPRVDGPHRISVFVEGEPTFDIPIEVEAKRPPLADDLKTLPISARLPNESSAPTSSESSSRTVNEKRTELSKPPTEDQQQENEQLLKRENEFNEGDNTDPASVADASNSLCGTAILNADRWHAGVMAPERYRSDQQYLLDGAERICSVGIGLGHLGNGASTKTASSDIGRDDPKHASALYSTLSTAKNGTYSDAVPKAASHEHPINLVSEFDKIRDATRVLPEPSPAQLSVSYIPRTVVGHNASLYLKHSAQSTPINRPARLSAWIEAPGGQAPKRVPIERATADDEQRPSGQNSAEAGEQYRVDFFPEVEGIHVISVRNDGKEIEGSPFHISVSPLGVDEAHRVTAHGTGLLTGQAGKLEKFHVTLPPSGGDNGGGEVSVTVDGPSRAEITLVRENEPSVNPKDDDRSVCRVEYRVDEPGLYNFDVRFNDAPIAGSPFKVFIKPRNDAEGSNRGTPTLSTTAPGLQLPYDTPAKYVRYEDGGAQKIEREISTRQINVPNSNKKEQMSDAPLELAGKPHRITTCGTGLDNFQLGETAKFYVDTSNAGVDLLFVGVVTSNEPCDEVYVRYVGNGIYEVVYCIRKLSSKAMIIIKYGDRQIPGSPFTVYSRRTNA